MEVTAAEEDRWGGNGRVNAMVAIGNSVFDPPGSAGVQRIGCSQVSQGRLGADSRQEDDGEPSDSRYQYGIVEWRGGPMDRRCNGSGIPS